MICGFGFRVADMSQHCAAFMIVQFRLVARKIVLSGPCLRLELCLCSQFILTVLNIDEWLRVHNYCVHGRGTVWTESHDEQSGNPYFWNQQTDEVLSVHSTERPILCIADLNTCSVRESWIGIGRKRLFGAMHRCGGRHLEIRTWTTIYVSGSWRWRVQPLEIACSRTEQ